MIKMKDLIKKQGDTIRETSGMKKPVNEVDFSKIKLPATVNRYLGRFVDSMKGANLNRMKRAAILYKVIDASGMSVQQLVADIQKIKRELQKGGDLASEGGPGSGHSNGNGDEGLRIEYTAIEKPFVVEDPDENSSLTESTSVSETSHINMNRMLSLAVVDYVKAQTAERDGNIQAKEYFMREFFNKLADNESNKNKAFVAQAVSPYAVK